MHIETNENSVIPTKDKIMTLSKDLQTLLPHSEEMLAYYDKANQFHINRSIEGGSKFNDPNIQHIFDVLPKIENLTKRVVDREDDREELKKLGATESAILPAEKKENMPVNLPVALYYKVDRIEGELGVEQIKNLLPDTKILVFREKGTRIEGRPDYCPVAFNAFVGDRQLPKTDFATVVIGRDPGSIDDSVWSIHPGAPIKILLKDFDWTKDLTGPNDVKPGEKQTYEIITASELLEKGMKPEEYIKIAKGDIENAIKKI